MGQTKTPLSQILKLKYPLFVAPMAGGPSSVELVSSASEAGALGFIGAAYSAPDAIMGFTEQVRSKTRKPFGINLFVPSKTPSISTERLSLALERTQKFRTELSLPAPALEPPYEEDFERQFETVLALRPNVLSFVFGVLDAEYLSAARKHGIYSIGTATTPEEARELEASGADAVVVQGVEAGGHRGIFDPAAEDPAVSTLDLVRATRERVKIPLVAAGGLMTSEDVRRALHAGADAVQMGTAFLATKEAGTSSPYRRKLLESSQRPTRLTRAFSGRLARGIINRFMIEVDADPESILPFPAQNKFTRDLRSASVAAGSSDCLSLWCGTGEGALWTGSTAELIDSLFH